MFYRVERTATMSIYAIMRKRSNARAYYWHIFRSLNPTGAFMGLLTNISPEDYEGEKDNEDKEK